MLKIGHSLVYHQSGVYNHSLPFESSFFFEVSTHMTIPEFKKIYSVKLLSPTNTDHNDFCQLFFLHLLDLACSLFYTRITEILSWRNLWNRA